MKGTAMKKTDRKCWNANTSKDTFWNLALLIGGVLILIVSVVDLPQEAPNQVAHAAYWQTTAAQ
jgi:hypothetical protein